MNSSEIKQFKVALKMFYDNPERLNKLYTLNQLKLCKSGTFVLSHILSDSVDKIDKEIMSDSVILALEIYEHEMYLRTVITGDFYNELRQRYLRVLNVRAVNNENNPTSSSHLVWMLLQLGSDEMSETKKHRWLGYIQGCMVMKNFITVQEERDLTRGVFNGK